MTDHAHFEIIDIARQRFSFDRTQYRWQFALKHGSMTELDKSCVEVFKILNADGDEELSRIFPAVMMVGDCLEDTCLLMPFERLITRCHKCGHCEVN